MGENIFFIFVAPQIADIPEIPSSPGSLADMIVNKFAHSNAELFDRV